MSEAWGLHLRLADDMSKRPATLDEEQQRTGIVSEHATIDTGDRAGNGRRKRTSAPCAYLYGEVSVISPGTPMTAC